MKNDFGINPFIWIRYWFDVAHFVAQGKKGEHIQIQKNTNTNTNTSSITIQTQTQVQIQIHFVAQVTGERGSLGGLGVPNTVEEATAYQVITYNGQQFTPKREKKKGQLETEKSEEGGGECKRYKQL